MANLSNNYFSDEEWKKMLDNLRNIPKMTWEHRYESLVNPIPFEYDENGIYGYKVLLRVGVNAGRNEYFSPSPFVPLHRRRWNGEEMQAHDLPAEDDWHSQAGIYGTKDLKHLEGWIEEYVTHYHRFASIDSFFSRHPFYLVVARVYVWGQIVETEYGFRAQFARIKEIIHEYR